MAKTEFVWGLNKFRQSIHRSKSVRGLAAILQNLFFGYYLNIYSSYKEPIIPFSINDFARYWNIDGYKGLLVCFVTSILLVIWLPIDTDPVLLAAEESAAKKIPILMKKAVSVTEVLAMVDEIKKGRTK